MGTREGGELILARYLGPMEAFSRIEGVRVIEAHCGHQCWLSPQGDAFLNESTGVLAVCDTCAGSPEGRPIFGVPGAIDTIAKVVEFERGSAAAERVRAEYDTMFPTFPGDSFYRRKEE